MPEFEIQTLTTADRELVNQFLQMFFGKAKGTWLGEYGDWWHRGGENRHAVIQSSDGAVAAYFATTPTEVSIAGQSVTTLWWIDLMVSQAFRRRGLQTLMDDNVRLRPGLKLGFPNQFHSTILEKHGWHIRKFHNHLLPLRPSGIRSVNSAKGNRGRVLKLAAKASEPGAWAWRRRLLSVRPKNVSRLLNPTSAQLVEIYHAFPLNNGVTTVRSAEFLQWRYLSAPYREQLRFYVAGSPNQPTHYLVSRDVDFRGLPATRILDLYGDFSDVDSVKAILTLAVQDAIRGQSNQVTLMNDMPHLQTTLRRLGFLFKMPVYFCSHATDVTMAQMVQSLPCYWTIGDSDNDGAT